MKKYILFAFIALFSMYFHSTWASTAYVKLTAEDGTVSWVEIEGTLKGTRFIMEIIKDNYCSAIDKNTKGSIDLNEVWTQSGGNGYCCQVTSIGEYAFYGCSSLTSVSIPSSVTSIGKSAFAGCRGLTYITIPSSVTSIGGSAFGSCSGLTSIEIPNSVTTIGENAFAYCSGFNKVIVKDIAAWCNISFGNSESNPLYNAHHLYSDEETEITKLTIPNSVTSIGNAAFSGYSGLSSIEIPSSVTSIGDYAFSGCSGLSSVTIPNSVTTIGQSAFSNCPVLTSLAIPNSVTTIRKYAFENCSALTSVTIGNSVNTIGQGVFQGCSGLTSATIGNGVTTIGQDAFKDCSGLTSVTIPNSVTSIGSWAFCGCRSLTSITIPNSVTSIGSCVFSDCSGLTSIEIPSSVTSISSFLFSDCSSLTSVNIPNSVTSINSYAFYGCSSLTSVTIPNSVTKIVDGAFNSCFALESIVVASGNPIYDSRNNCNAIIETATNTLITGCKRTVIPNSVTTIGNRAFAGGEYASTDNVDFFSITIPNSVTSIGYDAFMNCTGLTSVIISESVTSIGGRAFGGCTGLNSVTIPNTVTSIGDWAFSGCNCYVICNRDIPPTAYNNTFNEDMMAIVPKSSVSIYQQATGWKNMSIQPSPCYLAETTQSTITLCSDDFISNFKAELNGVSYYSKNDTIKITGLEPNTEYTISLSGDFEDLHLEYQMNVTTKNVNLGIELVKRTNLTLRLKGYNVGDAVFSGTGFEGYEGQNEVLIKDLVPGRTYYYTYYVVTPSGKKFSTTNSFQTLPITLNVSANTGPSSALLSGSSNIIDATVTDYGFEGYPEQNPIKITGLDPNKSYSQTFYIITKEGGRVSKSVTYTTKSLTLTTSQPKVISAGNVIVAAESNLDDEETNVGFEWRRIDWTDDFASNKGNAYLYNGTMEGYIRSLYTEKLWKYRPYYTSNAGNTYYGEWVGIDPTNTSYFEPTVHTYANVTVNGNSAEVKGYVQRGTDNVVSKGFAYWEQSQGVKSREAIAAPSKISSLPSNAKSIEVSGSQQVMTASLSNLEYETTYCYVAFVRTSEGDTFYGEEMTFTSGESPYTLGDVNGDKEIDISDVVAMVNHILGNTSSTSFKPQAADINKDGNIDISDVVSLVNMILGQ